MLLVSERFVVSFVSAGQFVFVKAVICLFLLAASSVQPSRNPRFIQLSTDMKKVKRAADSPGQMLRSLGINMT